MTAAVKLKMPGNQAFSALSGQKLQIGIVSNIARTWSRRIKPAPSYIINIPFS